MAKRKTNKALLLVFIGVVLISLVTITYAFFTIIPTTTTEQNVTAQAGTMRLIMNDGNTGWSEVWDFGESKSKTLTLQNTGTLPVTVDLYWKNLVNTFLEGSMVYSLRQTTDTSEETYLVGSASTFENIPTSATSVSTNKIAEEITVPANKTYTYTLTIQLVNSPTVDQTADLNANFYTEFDIKEYEPPLTIANYIKNNVYGTDTTLYLHSNTATGNNETSIANWTDAASGNANDGAYRYSGPDADVHNYICFGTSDKSTCLNDTSDNGNSKYLFRIISVKGDNVKLIKALPLYNTKTSTATFRWDYEGSTSSGYSSLWKKPSTLKEYLNTGTSSRPNYSSNYPDIGYLQSWDSAWQSKIADNMTWYIGKYITKSEKVKTFYNAEHGVCSNDTCFDIKDTTTKIGLMNVYDYGYAASPTSWAIDNLSYYSASTITASNWLYRSTNSSDEWTIAGFLNGLSIFYVRSNGSVDGYYPYYGYAVRPVLYLTSNVAYKSGTGTSTDPFLIS